MYQTIRSFANSGNVSPRAFANANRLVELEQHMHIFVEQPIQEALLSAGRNALRAVVDAGARSVSHSAG